MSVVKFNRRGKVVVQNRSISLHFTSIFLFIFGIIFIITSFFVLSNTKKLIESGVKTDATIVTITPKGYGEDVMYEVFVEYTVNNEDYMNVLNVYNSSMYEGKIVSIRYLPENPNNIMYVNNEYLSFWLFLIFGVIAISISIYTFKAYKKSKNY